MSRRLSIWLIVAFFAGTYAAARAAGSPFTFLPFSDDKQFKVFCAARYECDIRLQAGERVNDGFNAHIDQWDPHIGYAGDKVLTPHLILRPAKAGLRTNIILTTTKRTYYLLAVSTNDQQPSYYNFNYDGDTYKSLSRLALATQTALRASGRSGISPSPSPTPANVADLTSICFDYDYGYLVDRHVQTDHVPFAKPSREALPASLVPKIVCSDGRHTYIDFPLQREVPSDLPISLAVTSEGDTLINYTYLADLNRYTIDGVYDSFVLELGSQSSPLRLRIYHAGRGDYPKGRRDPKPIPISTESAGTTSGASPTPSATMSVRSTGAPAMSTSTPAAPQ